VWREGQAGVPETQLLSAGFNKVTEDYFRTMQIPILRGRPIGEQDQKNSARVAVINETMASRLWPGENPIGHHFSFTKSDAPPVEVVGVAKNGKYQWIAEDPSSFFYVPLSQNYASARILQVRTQVPPKSLTDGIEREIRALDADLPIFDVDTMEESLGGGNGFFLLRIAALMAGSLGLLGLLLAVVGVYGVVAYSVGQRTHEIGIRMAIGAQPPNILRMIVGQGLALVGIGLGIGLAMSLGFTRLVRNLLFQVGGTDPLTFVLVSLLLTGVALGACYIPARRATHVDPLVALRYE